MIKNKIIFKNVEKKMKERRKGKKYTVLYYT